MKTSHILNKTMKISDFDIGKGLGGGSFGKVYLVRTKKDNFICVLKILERKKLSDHEMDAALKREVDIQAQLSHPNMLKLYSYFWDDESIALVQEYAANGELYTMLQKSHISNANCSTYILQLIDLIQFCHSRGLILRNIKPECLMIGYHNEILLTDFGFSSNFDTTKRANVDELICYQAPELLRKDSHDYNVDLWSLGVLTYEMLTQIVPFQGDDRRTIVTAMFKLTIRSTPPTKVLLVHAEDFITKLLQKQPARRMSLYQARQHPWITKYAKKCKVTG